LVFSIALGFKFASIISFIVKEREDKSKHQQIVSGMNILAYWFGNFIYDYVLYLVLAVFSFLMCLALDVDAFTGDAFGPTVCVFIIYGLAYIPLTYIIAYVFTDYGNAQAGYYFFTFVVGGLVSIIVLVLRILGGTANTVGLVLGWIFRIIPSYCFGEILINLGSINFLSVV
jgi:ATP-binding cassette subfamily A (ABC1) protein 3